MIPALVLAAALCGEPSRIRVGPVHVEPQCNYFAGDVDAEGEHVFGAWMTSRYGGFTPNVTGSISGGALDESGALRGAAQQFITPAPSIPSVATNGTRSLIAYTINSGTFVQFDDALPAFRLGDGKGIRRRCGTAARGSSSRTTAPTSWHSRSMTTARSRRARC